MHNPPFRAEWSQSWRSQQLHQIIGRLQQVVAILMFDIHAPRKHQPMSLRYNLPGRADGGTADVYSPAETHDGSRNVSQGNPEWICKRKEVSSPQPEVSSSV